MLRRANRNLSVNLFHAAIGGGALGYPMFPILASAILPLSKRAFLVSDQFRDQPNLPSHIGRNHLFSVWTSVDVGH